MTEFAHPPRPGRKPEESLGSQQAVPGTGEKLREEPRIERTACAVYETRNPVLLGLGNMVLETFELLLPERMQLSSLGFKPIHADDCLQWDPPEVCLFQFGIGVQRPDD